MRSCLIVFGADQIQKSRATSQYFDQFVVAWQLGIILETLILVIADQNKHDVFFTMYVIATSLLVVFAVLFLLGWRYYLHVKVFESVIRNCIPVLVNACQTWLQSKKKKRNPHVREHGSHVNHAWHFSHSSEDETRQDESVEIEKHSSTCLNFARTSRNGKFHDRIVNDVISLRNAIITLLLLFPYRIIMSQVDES